jgi:hypothetical protein
VATRRAAPGRQRFDRAVPSASVPYRCSYVSRVGLRRRWQTSDGPLGFEGGLL